MQILVVDDDQAVRDSLKRSLEYSGYEVNTAIDGVEALARLAVLRPDAVIMDVMMPRLDGLEATRSLRSAGNDVPILVLTARDAVGDRVDGLDAGADDYLAKPFALDELLARLRALVRRAGTVAESADPSARNLQFSDLILNTQTREVLRGSRSINLTRTEFALLEAFLTHPRRVLERSWLLLRDPDHGRDERGRHAIAGPPQWIAERLAEYLDAGCDGFVVNLEYERPGLEERVALFADEVRPLLPRLA